MKVKINDDPIFGKVEIRFGIAGRHSVKVERDQHGKVYISVVDEFQNKVETIELLGYGK